MTLFLNKYKINIVFKLSMEPNNINEEKLYVNCLFEKAVVSLVVRSTKFNT